MRKVIFKKWIPLEYIKGPGNIGVKVEGTGCFEKDFNSNGFFHQWGLSAIETDDQVASYTIGIVENEDGSIEEVDPTNLKFITPVI